MMKKMPDLNVDRHSSTRHAAFHTTRWSLVLSAQGKASSHDEAFASLETLCRQYWRPLYAYVRHRGSSAHDAQDLTQEFFARLLEKDWLHAADRDKGRFRAFLLMALKRFLANEWDRTQAQKRGPGTALISLDAELAETLYAADRRTALPADSLFDRSWAMTLLETVMNRLRIEYDSVPRLAEYEALKPCLTAERGDIRYDELAATLGISQDLARTKVHRLRKRFREVFREEVSSTVANPADVDDEMRAVIAALGQE